MIVDTIQTACNDILKDHYRQNQVNGIIPRPSVPAIVEIGCYLDQLVTDGILFKFTIRDVRIAIDGAMEADLEITPPGGIGVIHVSVTAYSHPPLPQMKLVNPNKVKSDAFDRAMKGI